MSKRGVDRRVAGSAVLFAALGDPIRLSLVDRLASDGPASITALADRFDVTRQAISKHLQVLAQAGVIAGNRRGREHVWTIDPARLADARAQLDRIAHGWDAALGRLKGYVERDAASTAQPAPRTADPANEWHDGGIPPVSAYISRSSSW